MGPREAKDEHGRWMIQVTTDVYATDRMNGRKDQGSELIGSVAPLFSFTCLLHYAMSNYEDVTYYRQRLEDFIVWLAGEKIEFAVRQTNGMLRPVPSGTVMTAYQDHREMIAGTRCSRHGCDLLVGLSELDEVS